MKDDLEKRACQLAVYMIETGATVRAAAKHFGISKSTVHKTLTQRLSAHQPGSHQAQHESQRPGVGVGKGQNQRLFFQ